MTGSLGIYIGPRVVNIVETKGKKVVKSITVPRPTVAGTGLEEKVPDDIKVATLIHEELRKNMISVPEAVLSLSGRDLIFRSFELPVLSQDELVSAVNFEAKKYIPFKVEELVSDFQIQYDRISRRNLVLFVGIKKDALERHLSVLRQFNIKAVYIDYSAFSILRFLKLAGEGNRGISGVISADFQEEGEAHFTVLESGFPAFSRDISLSGGPKEFESQSKEIETGMLMEKLKTELRISLDYYHRKFPSKRIGNFLILVEERYRPELETFCKDLGFSVKYVDTAKYSGGRVFSLSFIKGYGSALYRSVATSLKVNLLAPKTRTAKKITAPREEMVIPEIKVSPGAVLLGLLIAGGAFGYGFYRTLPASKELEEVVSRRPQIADFDNTASYDSLRQVDEDIRNKLATANTLIRRQLLLTDPLNVIPRVIPDNLWLTDFTFQKDATKADLVLKGFVSLGNTEKEMKLVSDFIARLKENQVFANSFKAIAITSMEEYQLQKIKATSFIINCRSQQ